MTCNVFFAPCQGPPKDISSESSFSVWSGGSLTIFPIPLGVGKLALKRKNFLQICVRCILRILAFWAGIWVMVMSGYMSVHPYAHQYVNTSLIRFIHLSVHLSVHFYIHQYYIKYYFLPTSMSDCWKAHLTWYLCTSVASVTSRIFHLDVYSYMPMFFLVVCSHYVLSYCDHYHYHSTCDYCVLQSIIHH